MVVGAAADAVAGAGSGRPRAGWWVRGPPLASSARARTGSVAGPVAGLSRDLSSGIIGDFAASLDAGISLAVLFYFYYF